MKRENKSPLKRTTFYVDPELLAKLKSKLALQGVSISQWLRKQMRMELNEF